MTKKSLQNNQKKNIAYITACVPFGKKEFFVLDEISELLRKEDISLTIAPLRPKKEKQYELDISFRRATVRMPILNLRIVFNMIMSFILHPKNFLGNVFNVFRYSRKKAFFKNFLIFPKSTYLARIFREKRIHHIHAHWASTPSTCAYIISQFTGIPWSFTAHRWDIAENNMLEEKARSSSFVRAISQSGRDEILSIVGEKYQEKIITIHLGVEVKQFERKTTLHPIPKITCVANLVEIKGHKYLLEALQILKSQGVKFQCILVGDGPEQDAIEKKIFQLKIDNQIELKGFLQHSEIVRIYKEETDFFVLPSIVTENNEKEGIPVVLMEAMSFKIPVISTNVGGIPELIGGGAGIIVEEKNPHQLAEAIRMLIEDKNLSSQIGSKGYFVVNDRFNLKKNVNILLNKMFPE